MILTPKKKGQSADTTPPQNFFKNWKNCRDQGMLTGLIPREQLWGHPSEKLIHGEGDIKWNGPLALIPGISRSKMLKSV